MVCAAGKKRGEIGRLPSPYLRPEAKPLTLFSKRVQFSCACPPLFCCILPACFFPFVDYGRRLVHLSVTRRGTSYLPFLSPALPPNLPMAMVPASPSLPRAELAAAQIELTGGGSELRPARAPRAAACRHAKLLLEAARQTLKLLKEELEAASLIFRPRDPFPDASPCCSSRPHRRRER
nr:unnamed protein product [Digitaria exilis]